MSMKSEGDTITCDCGFSFQRGQSGKHECADGLRAKLAAAVRREESLKASVDVLGRRIAELEQPAPIAPDDYFSSLVVEARLSADKAMKKHPQPNYVLLKVAEEAGEVVQASVHFAENRMSWDQVEGEIVQLMAMLIRLVTEGDQVNGITPPDACRATMPAEPVSQGYTLNSPVIPDGWKLVPNEPTTKQWAAGHRAMEGGVDKVTLAYRAMVEVAPPPGDPDDSHAAAT
ncbi:hypothetical protein [Serratia sp. JSRIV004]|uniref:hypothetical protein n=1 Tax=Serratia sp. JSRIV004 TaxID=2831895 RepID=UPI001CBB6A47|nr:hypothetical protein [Serratia sp. JSRIV004]UAN58313.1 hypothetical protein KGP21_04330 [Serratia sp. JSRIV004]